MTDRKLTSTRDGMGQGLLEAAGDQPKVVGLCADLSESTRLHWFAEAFPERFFQVGVAEQNLAGTAAGLALGGYIPVAASYACFHPANSWGVIRTSICYSNLNVKLIGGHAGLTTGQDGATHQSLEDIALMRVLPNMTVLIPADAQQAREAMHAAIAHQGPVYIRTSKATATPLPPTPEAFQIGRAQTLQQGSDITIIGCGTLLVRALQAAVILEHYHGISTRIVNMHSIKPLDTAAIDSAARSTQAILTLEDHQVHGGLGGAVAEYLAQQQPMAVLKIMGVQDSFGQSGSSDELLDFYGLGVTDIVAAVIELMQRKQAAHASMNI